MLDLLHGVQFWTCEKAKAESAVQVVERWILMRLRHQKFETVDEVNEAMAPLLVQLNNKPFQKLPGCRASVFAEIDAPALQWQRTQGRCCLLYTSPSPRDRQKSRMPSSA